MIALAAGLLGSDVLAGAANAAGGTYQWNICREGTPVGSAAALDHVSVAFDPGANATQCWANNGHITTTQGSHFTAATGVSAPAGSKITAHTVRAMGNNYSFYSAWGYVLASSAGASCSYYESTFGGLACQNGVAGFNTGVPYITYNTAAGGDANARFGIYCRAQSACSVGTLDLYIDTWIVTIRDDTSPTLSVGGDLWTSAPVKNTVPLAYSVSDNAAGGAGIRVYVDGNEVTSTAAADSAGCSDDVWHHCPDDRGAVGVPLAGIAEGTHTLTVRGYDSVGNMDERTRSIFVDQLPPAVTGLKVTGSPVEGQTLVCNATINGQEPSTTYAWLTTNADGSSPRVVDGASDPTYVLRTADVGKKVLCRVSATDHGGTTTVTSQITDGPFADGVLVSLAPPTVTPATVMGATIEGQTLTCQSAVVGTNATTTVRWIRLDADGAGGVTIAGANGRTYTLTSADVSHRIQCSVSATNVAGEATTTSDPLGTSAVTAKPAAGGSGGGPTGTDTAGGPSGGTVTTQTGTTPSGTTQAGNTSAAAVSAATNDLNVVPVANPDGSGTNGTPADPQANVSVYFQLNAGSAKRTVSAATARFAQRLRIRGTIKTHDGRPIVGAKLYLAQTTGETDSNGNAVWKINGGTISQNDGSILLFSAASGRSRQIRLVYFPYGGRVANRGSNLLSLKVKQDASLRLSASRLRNGQTLTFAGRVRGATSSGTKVQLQVKLPAGWSTFRSAKVSASGAYRARYTFRRTTRRTTYRFRARVVPGAAAGYVASTSSTRKVVVRP